MKFIVIETKPIKEYKRDEEGNYPNEKCKNQAIINLHSVRSVYIEKDHLVIITTHGTYEAYEKNMLYKYFEWLKSTLTSLGNE